MWFYELLAIGTDKLEQIYIQVREIMSWLIKNKFIATIEIKIAQTCIYTAFFFISLNSLRTIRYLEFDFVLSL